MPFATITKPAQATDLTLLETVKAEIALTVSDDDDFITTLISQASSAIADYTQRVFGRIALVEGLPSTGRVTLMVSYVPIIKLSQLVYLALGASTPTVIDPTLYFVSDPDVGLIYNPNGGWASTEIYGFPALFASDLSIMPAPPNPNLYQATYSAGWLLPGDDIEESTAISFSASDSSINITGANFPNLDVGDVVKVKGSQSNDATYIVAATPLTAQKIIVTSAVVNESAGNSIDLTVRTLPAAIERATIETVKGWYFSRDRDWQTTSERIGTPRAGGWEANYAPDDALPPQAKRLLSKYRLNV